MSGRILPIIFSIVFLPLEVLHPSACVVLLPTVALSVTTDSVNMCDYMYLCIIIMQIDDQLDPGWADDATLALNTGVSFCHQITRPANLDLMCLVCE